MRENSSSPPRPPRPHARPCSEHAHVRLSRRALPGTAGALPVELEG